VAVPDSPFPAWPLLLAALFFAAVGVWVLVGVSNVLWAVVLFVAAVTATVGGVWQGRKALRVAPSTTAPPAPVKETTVGDYTDEAAVRSAMKWKRTCPTCNSPVLEKAAVCPTCESAL
jgi:hypothetical protein